MASRHLFLEQFSVQFSLLEGNMKNAMPRNKTPEGNIWFLVRQLLIWMVYKVPACKSRHKNTEHDD